MDLTHQEHELPLVLLFSNYITILNITEYNHIKALFRVQWQLNSTTSTVQTRISYKNTG